VGFFDDLFGRLPPRPPIDVFGGQGLDAFGELMGDGSDALQPITPFGPSGGFLGGLGSLTSSSPAFWQMPQLGGGIGAGYQGAYSPRLPIKGDTLTPARPGLFSKKPAATPGTATSTTPSSGTAGDIWGVIDEEARDDPRLAQALKLAVQLESGGRAEAVGDQGQSHGFYQIHQPAHGRNITPEQSRDPRRATQYRLAEFRQAKDRVTRERPGLWEANPMEAAALTAFWAQRPAQMYGAANVQQAWQTIQQRQQAPATAQTFRTGGQWDHLVPGGQGRVERGGTHGGHPAIDIFAPAGTPIRAPADGVSSPGQYPLGGNATTLRDDQGRWHYFAHAQAPMRGGPVKKGDIIGYVGNTGNARGTASHLHYATATSADAFERFNGSGDLDPT
jgi:murein DD-endopeptidase MepM/ murein hydrolase activator NlpD